MTIQQLINRLSRYENKSLPVFFKGDIPVRHVHMGTVSVAGWDVNPVRVKAACLSD